MRKKTENIALFTFSILIMVIIIEFSLPNFIEISEIGFSGYDEEVGLHYYPSQKFKNVIGTTKPQISEVNINSQGWNSIHDFYEKSKTGKRIVIIGDSFIEGRQVDYDKTLSSNLEYRLNTIYENLTVYNFAYMGWPLSQYIKAINYSIKFNPDLIIVNLIENDFEESLSIGKNDIFDKYLINGSFITIVPPKKYHSNILKKIISKSNIVKLIYVNTQFPDFFYKLSLNKKVNPSIPTFTKFALLEIKNKARQSNSELIIMMAPRKNYPSHKPQHYNFNNMIFNISNALNITYLDLTDSFMDDYIQYNHSFCFVNDKHWNEHAHNLVSNTLATFIIDKKILEKKS